MNITSQATRTLQAAPVLEALTAYGEYGEFERAQYKRIIAATSRCH